MNPTEALSLNIDYSGTQVRMVGTTEAPEWVAADVCGVLGIANPSDAVSRMPVDCRGIVLTDTPSGEQEMLTVTEPGLYRLIARSRKPEAERFQRFVFHEVMPSIRKFGRYPAPGAMTVVARSQEWVATRTELIGAIEAVTGPRFDALDARMSSVEQHLERVPVIRKEIPEHTKRQALVVIEKDYNSKCPNCLRAPIFLDGAALPNLRWDHRNSRGLVGPGDVWPSCVECNYMLGEPGSLQRSEHDHKFRTFQDYRRIRFGDGHRRDPKQPGQLTLLSIRKS